MIISAASPQGPVVSITGAAQGIGKGVALAFAAQGARLVLSDINEAGVQATAHELRSHGAQAVALRADVCSAADMAEQVASAVRQFGRLDVAVCNAGIVQIKPFLELDASDWERMLAVNVTGSFLTLQASARQMLIQDAGAADSATAARRPRGKVILIASIAGRQGAGPIASLIAPYRASKAAVISLAQSAAISLAPHITVNAICPGLVDTDMWRGMDRELAALQGIAPGEPWRQRTANVPLGRPQTPADVAGLALYLASPAADYMTGQSINIDGGLMMN